MSIFLVNFRETVVADNYIHMDMLSMYLIEMRTYRNIHVSHDGIIY